MESRSCLFFSVARTLDSVYGSAFVEWFCESPPYFKRESAPSQQKFHSRYGFLKRLPFHIYARCDICDICACNYNIDTYITEYLQ